MSSNRPDRELQDEVRGTFLWIGPYFAALYTVLGLGNPNTGIAQVPVQFLLKEQLHLGPERLALFELAVATPLYAALAFGFLRDRWSPLGRRDRGYFLLFGPLAALAYVPLARTAPDYATLLAGMLAATFFYRFLSSAVQGLTTVVGQDRGMTGRLASLYLFVCIPSP